MTDSRFDVSNASDFGLNPSRKASREEVDQARVESRVGNPSDKLLALKDLIQNENVREFAKIEVQFLDLLWTLDAYRTAHVIPRTPRGIETAVASKKAERDLTGEGLYRSKGNYFSELMALLLGNKTTSSLAPRSRVAGFSQVHQIDIAWPDRGTPIISDPLICCEAKLTGAPGVQGGKARGGMADWSNRRKELKFQATDLKLGRHKSSTSIHNWNSWRKKAEPRVYTLWAARLEDPKGQGNEGPQFSKMVAEAQNLTATYSDGVGIFAFRANAKSDGYESMGPLREAAARFTSLDEVLDEIAGEIKSIMEANDNRIPAPRWDLDPTDMALEASE